MQSATRADAATTLALTDVVNEFAHLVDFDDGVGVAELFTSDGRFAFDGAETVGREAIAATYARRAARGDRTARHLVTNLRLRSTGEDTASGVSIMLIFAADGVAPLPIRPMLVADVDDEFRRVDGRWYLAQRTYRSVFVDEQSPPVLPIAREGVTTT